MKVSRKLRNLEIQDSRSGIEAYLQELRNSLEFLSQQLVLSLPSREKIKSKKSVLIQMNMKALKNRKQVSETILPLRH